MMFSKGPYDPIMASQLNRHNRLTINNNRVVYYD
jgi:hypothetical protein